MLSSLQHGLFTAAWGSADVVGAWWWRSFGQGWQHEEQEVGEGDQEESDGHVCGGEGILMVKTEVSTPPKQVRTENSIFALFGESIN